MNKVTYFVVSLFILILISNCSTSKSTVDKNEEKELSSNIPFTIIEANYQSWIAGVEGGGSGINVNFKIVKELPKTIQLDSIFFRGKRSKVEQTKPKEFMAKFITEVNQNKDLIMSNEPYAEYGNTLPEMKSKSFFELKDNECVISYYSSKNKRYYKITNLTEKQIVYYPSAPPKKQ